VSPDSPTFVLIPEQRCAWLISHRIRLGPGHEEDDRADRPRHRCEHQRRGKGKPRAQVIHREQIDRVRNEGPKTKQCGGSQIGRRSLGTDDVVGDERERREERHQPGDEKLLDLESTAMSKTATAPSRHFNKSDIITVVDASLDETCSVSKPHSVAVAGRKCNEELLRFPYAYSLNGSAFHFTQRRTASIPWYNTNGLSWSRALLGICSKGM
jgi:hypothetical protein